MSTMQNLQSVAKIKKSPRIIEFSTSRKYDRIKFNQSRDQAQNGCVLNKFLFKGKKSLLDITIKGEIK